MSIHAGMQRIGVALRAPALRFWQKNFLPAALQEWIFRTPQSSLQARLILMYVRYRDITAEAGKRYHLLLERAGTFYRSDETLLRLVKAARKHAVILVPLHDTLDIKEHFSRFSEDFFPISWRDIHCPISASSTVLAIHIGRESSCF
jgi:hypothetical protein